MVNYVSFGEGHRDLLLFLGEVKGICEDAIFLNENGDVGCWSYLVIYGPALPKDEDPVGTSLSHFFFFRL